MGIQDNNKPQNSAMADAMNEARTHAPQFDASKAGGQSASPASGLRGIAYVNSLISRPMSRTGVGEQTMAYVDAIRSAIDKGMEKNEAAKYVVLPIERNTYELATNVIVLATKVNFNNGIAVLAYPILVEPSEGMQSRYLPMGNGEVEIPTTPADAYDERTQQAISIVLRNHFSFEGDIDEVAFNILPNELAASDEKRMGRLAALAINALDGAAKELPGLEEERFSVNLISGTKERPTGIATFGRMDFNPAPRETVSGLPVRNDIAVTTKLVLPRQNQDSVGAATAPILTQIGGYIDLTYIEPQMQATGPFGQMVKSTNAYQARFVMTNMEVEANAVTPELGLFALASSFMLNNGNAWINFFKKRHGVENDTRDVGAIGYEINLATDGTTQLGKVDTSAPDFNLHSFVSRTFREGLVFSIDVAQGGDDSWVWTTLEYAAHGDQGAIQEFLDTANNLTNGHFAKRWNQLCNAQGGQPEIARHSGNVIQLGYFVANNGQKEDLRRIDYLAMLNLFGKDDIKTVIDFANTYDPTSGDPVQRLGERTRKLRDALQDNIHFKGLAQRYDLNPLVLETLCLSIQDAGMNIIPEAFFGEFNQTVRGNESLAAFAARPSATPLWGSTPTNQRGSQFATNLFTPRGGRFGN